jgi:type II secretory pathway component PulM
MMAPLQTWWVERSIREQRMLVVLVFFLAAIFLWFGVLQPVQTGLSAARARHMQVNTALESVTAKAAAFKQIIANPPAPLGSPIAAFVSSSASEAGFTLSRADPVGPDAVIVALTSAKSPAFFAWVDIMRRRGVFVERAAINTNSDATIRVDATFKASAR